MCPHCFAEGLLLFLAGLPVVGWLVRRLRGRIPKRSEG